MSHDFQNKVALITGGTTGIGRETAVLFAKHGAKVVISGRREKEGKEAVALVKAAGREGMFVQSDVSKSAHVQSLVKKSVDTYGRLDIAFNNAGVEGAWAPLADLAEENWDYVHNINLRGLWLCLKYEIQQMTNQGGGGTIVNMSSVAGVKGYAGAGAYVASKHGVLGLTKTAALECSSLGIRVNAVCPAVIETDMAARLFADPDVNKRVLAQHPLGRFGKAVEVAEAVLWLCSEKSSFTTGQFIAIDGGLLTGVNPNA